MAVAQASPKADDSDVGITGAKTRTGGSDQIRALASDTVVVTGTVDDVRPYYHGALISVVPLRVGGGTRLKVLEAMAAGTPVVSTTLGAEGFAVTHGKDILIAVQNQFDKPGITHRLHNRPRLRVAAQGSCNPF